MTNLEDIKYNVRNAIDTNWSRHRRLIVGTGAVVVTVAALAFGIWAMNALMPLHLPKTADEAVAVMNSPKFEHLDRERRAQYADAAARLLRDVPADQRRAMFGDEDARRAMMQAMRERMDDAALRLAMGAKLEDVMPQMPFGRRPGGPPGGPRDGARNAPPDDGQRPEPTAEQREQWAQRRAEGAKRMMAHFANALQSGNTQRMALRMEMFQRMRQMREANGGGDRPPPP